MNSVSRVQNPNSYPEQQAGTLARSSRIATLARHVFRFLLYAIVAALVLNIFMEHWGLRDQDPRFGFSKMLTFEADRPFVYRILLPATVNALAELTPPGIRSFVDSDPEVLTELATSPERRWSWSKPWWAGRLLELKDRFAWGPEDRLQKVYAYLILFGCLIALCFVLRELTLHFTSLRGPLLDVAPAVALLFLPLSFQGGGHVYDFPDLLFLSIALLLVARRRWLLYYLVYATALLNKETSVLFGLSIWALHRHSLGYRRLLGHVATHVGLAALILIPIRYILRSNPGAIIESHLMGNVRYLLSPSSYFVVHDVYTPLIVFPVLYNVLALGLTVILATYRWADKPRELRVLFLSYMAVLVPLYVYGGWYNEIRAFYLAAPAFYLLSLHTVLSVYRVGSWFRSAAPETTSTQKASIE